ncbi:TPA: hypothetical protein DIT45_02780 [Candidatus Acetothermia bacterium]|nr:hypothetical protein [Candidatus Acetothermia bacterium]
MGSPVRFDGSTSHDPDGTIVSYNWSFGDGASGTGTIVQHPYNSTGTYTVRLTVTDDDGATNTATQQVTITQAPNQAPVASFTYTPPSPLVGSPVRFDGSTSHDPDGTIVSYNWSFGDGASGTGTIVQHPYASTGTYTVRLTVTDDDSATNTATQQVSVTQAPKPDLTVGSISHSPVHPSIGESVTFTIIVNNQGGAPSGAFRVRLDGATSSTDGNVPQLAASASTTVSLLLPLTQATETFNVYIDDLNQVTESNEGNNTTQEIVEAAPSNGGAWVSPTGYSDPDDFFYYEARAYDDDTATKCSSDKGVRQFVWTFFLYLKLPSPRECSKVRFMVSDNYGAWAYSRIDVDVYKDGRWVDAYKGSTSERRWKTVTFSAGMVSEMRIRGYRNSVPKDIFFYVHEADFYVIGGVPPTPAVTADAGGPYSGIVGQPVTFDGSGSSGPISQYLWNFDDGTSGQGITTPHTYSAPGTYTVTLNVHGTGGQQSTDSTQVTISQPSPPQQLTIDLSLPKTSYQVGENIIITYATNSDAYVYICEADPSGRLSLVFPNARETNNRVAAGTHTLPGGGYRLRVSEPPGQETLYAFAATSRLPNFPTYYGGGFAFLSANAGAFINAVRQTMQAQLPASDRSEDAIGFNVLSSAPTAGTLTVSSFPQGASITIDGAPYGTTPAQFSLNAGVHALGLSYPGYNAVSEQVTIAAGQTTNRSYTLVPLATNQPPVANFTISPSNPAVGQAVSFNASTSYDPDGSIVSYVWNFGDGNSAWGPYVSHTYAAGMTYLVQLTVTDDDGASQAATRSLPVASVLPYPPPWGGIPGGPPMGTTPGIFVWGTDTWHITVNAGSTWTSAHSYKLELRTDGSFENVNQSTSGGVVPLGIVPTPTEGGKTLTFQESLRSGSIDYTFTVSSAKSIWMSLKLDIDGDGDLEEVPSFIYLRNLMVHPPTAPFVVGLPSGSGGPLVPSMNFRIGYVFPSYTAPMRFLMMTTDINTLEGH